MRGLKDRFIEELQKGKLAWVLELVKSNDALFLSIEKNAVHIFYKGNNILEIKAGGGYSFIIDEKYFTTEALKDEYAIFNRDKKAAGVYQRKFPILIEAMDTSYATTCHPQDVEKQKVACKNSCILAQNYQIPPAFGEGVIDMIGICDGKLMAFQHNLGQPAASLAATYKSVEKMWSDPTEKENLIKSANDIGTNLMILGLLEEAPHVNDGDLTFVALLTDCAANPDVKAQFQGNLEAKAMFLDGTDGVLDMSKAI